MSLELEQARVECQAPKSRTQYPAQVLQPRRWTNSWKRCMDQLLMVRRATRWRRRLRWQPRTRHCSLQESKWPQWLQQSRKTKAKIKICRKERALPRKSLESPKQNTKRKRSSKFIIHKVSPSSIRRSTKDSARLSQQRGYLWWKRPRSSKMAITTKSRRVRRRTKRSHQSRTLNQKPKRKSKRHQLKWPKTTKKNKSSQNQHL